MCAPIVIESVRREISRRGFLSLAAMSSGAATVFTSGDLAAAQRKPPRMPRGFRDVIDLTHPFSPRLPVYPAYKPVQVRQRYGVEKDGFAANEVTFDEHTGTHMDAPSHFVRDGMSADRIPADRLVAPLAVVSIVNRAAQDADAVVTVDDLAAWEKRHGRLPAGAFVAMHSGWDARTDSTDRFLNRDAKGSMHTPGFSADAARFLVEQRDIVGVGVDTLSLDAGSATTFVAHLTFLGAAKYGVEVLANLGRVPPSGGTVVIGAPKHEGATGGPVRALALV